VITSRLVHPEILGALASAGHGSTLLVTDAHYAAATAVGPNARTVYLNLERGKPTVPEVLSVVLDTIAVEKVTHIEPSADALPCEVHSEIDALLGPSVDRQLVDRFGFYRLARNDDLALAVVTGDVRRFGNVLLTVGVLRPR
jgi:L-fucose mutarotase